MGVYRLFKYGIIFDHPYLYILKSLKLVSRFRYEMR